LGPVDPAVPSRVVEIWCAGEVDLFKPRIGVSVFSAIGLMTAPDI
jgi:hypothetical protein